jgi:hypothetical protein
MRWRKNTITSSPALESGTLVAVFFDDVFPYKFKCVIKKSAGSIVTLQIDAIFSDDAGTEVTNGEVVTRFRGHQFDVERSCIFPLNTRIADSR